ncbi:MAG: hypothetical protein Q9186_000538 [Xanthomendoza sp. 1 TL-2023]
MSRKRHRDQLDIDTQLVEIYDDLANENEAIRFAAARAFLTKFGPGSDSSSEQLSEAVRRLVRGLCSGRKAARIGFSIALTEFLSQKWGNKCNPAGILQISGLIDVLIRQTEATGNVSGQEERDHQFGRLFGAEAFIKSGVLFQANAPADAWDRVLDIIYEAAKRKSWLREECSWILYGAAQTLTEGDRDPTFIKTLIEQLCKNGLSKTPEGIAIWLKVRATFPKVELPAGIWQNENPLHRKENSKLAKILQETSTADRRDKSDEEAPQKGSWTSRIHFVWDVIFSELITGGPTHGTALKSDNVSLNDFWQVAVDEHLFASTSSDQRKYWGFLLFQRVFGSAPEPFLSSLFSPNFMRCLTNQLASKERYLHRAAEKTIKAVLKRASVEPTVASAVLRALLAHSFERKTSFDRITRTKTTEKLMSLGDDSSLRQLVPDLCYELVRPDVTDETHANAWRQTLVDQLAALLKSRQMSATPGWHSSDAAVLASDILEFLVKYSYFSIQGSQTDQRDRPVLPMSEKTQDIFKTRLSSCLSHILSKWPNPVFFISSVVRSLLRLESDGCMRLHLHMSDTLGGIVDHARTFLEKMHKQPSAKSPDKTSLDAFELLYSLTVLQIYNGDADAVSMFNELHSCYDLLVQPRKGDQHGSEILVEILLSFLAKPSQLFRRLAQQVFNAFAPDIDRDGLESMFKVLATKESLSGQYEIFEGEDDGSHSVNGGSTTNSDVEEVEMTDVNGIQDPSDEEGGSLPANRVAEEPDTSEEEDQELAAFNMKLAQALKTRPLNAVTGAASDENSTDEDMDDEQMAALDEHIADIFKEKKKVVSKKKQSVDAKETIVNFKCRVLELLEIFVKKRHTDSLSLDLLMPLLETIRTTTSSLVSNKACNIMREFSKLCKGHKVAQLGRKSAIVKLLKEVHSEAMRESSNAHASACSQASLLLVKILVARDRDNVRKVVKIYAHTQKCLLSDPKCRVKMSFFSDWLNWCNTARPA